MALPLNTRLVPYDIAIKIGAGGMGYLARDAKRSRDVVLKIPPETFTRDTERLGRLRREALSRGRRG